jgi:hypothetical protein
MSHWFTHFAASAFSIVLMACQAENEFPDRYFDYSGADGCAPPNIGHALGGDLPGYAKNSLEGMTAIADQQSSDCFKNWEADLYQSADVIVLSHDSDNEGRPLVSMTRNELPDEKVTLDEFTAAFVKLNLRKPLILDIKNVSNPSLWPALKQAARSIKGEGQIPVWFIIDGEAADAHAGICEFMAGEFDIMLYRQGGPLCI